MVNENKKNLFVAVAGAVVGAGAVLAGAVALAEKKNQDKVSAVLAKGQKAVKETANIAIKSAEKVTKVAKREVRKI